MILYALPGSRAYQERLYPDPACLDSSIGLTSHADVIAHFTANSLQQDGIQIQPGSLHVTLDAGRSGYMVAFRPLAAFVQQAEQFATMHVAMLNAGCAGLALAGADACRETPAWNPMAGYPVNAHDGPSEWLPCLPLGMPMVNHLAVTLLHYPPIVAYRTADYLQNATLRRWAQVLQCAGMDQPERYHAIVDVNPIAAPGSGESEYPNDFFPISLTSLFFDNEPRGLTYVRSMLELMLDPPSNAANPATLPLLVCGSPLYDPQAPGWFRIRFKDQLPKNKNGTPTADVLQAGWVRLRPDSAKPTPYMVANHMIAAGVTGRCTDDPSRVPDIRKYEAQDLVAATFLQLCSQAADQGLAVDPTSARAQACRRWFGPPPDGGADDGSGAPNPEDENDRLTICALAQMDLCFDPKTVGPVYHFEQARERCRSKGGAAISPCFGCGAL